jgi:hypothetical protein
MTAGESFHAPSGMGPTSGGAPDSLRGCSDHSGPSRFGDVLLQEVDQGSVSARSFVRKYNSSGSRVAASADIGRRAVADDQRIRGPTAKGASM